MKRIKQALLTSSIAIAQAFPSTAFAQLGDRPGGVPSQFDSLANIIKSAFNITIVVSGIIFVFLLLLGGVQYLTSLGNEDSSTKARKLIINGVIGLVIVLTAYALGNYILSLLGIDTAVNNSINNPSGTGTGIR